MTISLRHYRYLNTYRLDELYGQAAPWRKRKGRLPVIKGFSFQAFGFGAGLTLDKGEEDPRFRVHSEIGYLEEYLSEKGRLGTFEDPGEGYFHGFLAMTLVPFTEVDPPPCT
jgi:hypothetical protein